MHSSHFAYCKIENLTSSINFKFPVYNYTIVKIQNCNSYMSESQYNSLFRFEIIVNKYQNNKTIISLYSNAEKKIYVHNLTNKL